MTTASNTRHSGSIPYRTPRFSIILPVRNQRKWAEKAVDSILRMSDPIGLEVVLVDDASHDGTSDHLHAVFGEWIATGRLSLIKRDRPCGDWGILWNEGAQSAQGSTLAFARPTVLWGPLRLTRITSALSKTDIIASHRSSSLSEPAETSLDVDWIRVLLQENYLAPGSLVLRRSLFDECGGFTEGYGGVLLPKRPPGAEEYELLLKALLRLSKQNRMNRFTLLAHQKDDLQDIGSDLEYPFPKMKEVLKSAEELKERVSLVTLTPKLPPKYWKTLAARVRDRIWK